MPPQNNTLMTDRLTALLPERKFTLFEKKCVILFAKYCDKLSLFQWEFIVEQKNKKTYFYKKKNKETLTKLSTPSLTLSLSSSSSPALFSHHHQL